MDKSPELLCNVLGHKCQGNNIEGEWQGNGNMGEVFGRHVSGG